MGAGLIVVIIAAHPTWAEDDPPKARLAAIEAAQKGAKERFQKGIAAAGPAEPEQQTVVDRYIEEVSRNTGSALDLARTCRDDGIAFEALKFVIRTNGSGPGDATAKALPLILEKDFARVPGQGDYLTHVALRLWQYPDAETLLRRVLADNPNLPDRAAACYALATHLQLQARIVRRLRVTPGDMKYYESNKAAAPIRSIVREKDPDALDREATALLGRAVADFGDVRMPGDKRSLGEFVPGEVFAARNLNVGQRAPDIEGTDNEGKPLKLGDHRGKVIVLTFSGNWCGPCVAMYPEERELVARLKDRPFVLVSVNTDADVKTLEESIASGKITWRCWSDGGTDGPITTRWGVTSFPTIYVLDRQGVIRFKNVRGDDLEQAVDTLLDEKPGP